MPSAYLGLGSNVGDRLGYLAEAMRRLHQPPQIRVETLSSVYETKPVGLTAQPDFMNLVVRVVADRSPQELLAACLQIETELGRVRLERWGPRTIDIDVLWYDAIALNEGALCLPHPRMKERSFVIVPLAEIAPNLMLDGEPAVALAARLGQVGLSQVGQLAWAPQGARGT